MLASILSQLRCSAVCCGALLMFKESSQGRIKLGHMCLDSAHQTAKSLVIHHCLVREGRDWREGRQHIAATYCKEYHHTDRTAKCIFLQIYVSDSYNIQSLLLWDCEMTAPSSSVLSVLTSHLQPSVVLFTSDL